ETIIPLEPSQDHKRAYEQDKGPNTGGMGAYSPVPFITESIMHEIIETILVPTVHALNRAQRRYQGVLYAGLILTPSGPKILEYNVRFGDPETQPLMMRLKTDLIPLLLAVTENKLNEITTIEWHPETTVCVIMTSSGYPGHYQKGFIINGLNKLQGQKDIHIFHAATNIKDGQVVTAGGRVLGVTALGQDIKQAQSRCYQAVNQISFKDSFFSRN
ncbi:phosphoribosylamine--glycine ligase, partial [Planctomycetota bacterium]